MITTEKLDVIERRARSFNETDLSLVPVECSEVIQLVAIARAALAWKNKQYGPNGEPPQEVLLAALEGRP